MIVIFVYRYILPFGTLRACHFFVARMSTFIGLIGWQSAEIVDAELPKKSESRVLSRREVPQNVSVLILRRSLMKHGN
jgi:hypothetical protein